MSCSERATSHWLFLLLAVIRLLPWRRVTLSLSRRIALILDVESIAGAIDEVVGDEQRRQRLSQAGLARAAAFRWSETARLTVQAYVDAASS